MTGATPGAKRAAGAADTAEGEGTAGPRRVGLFGGAFDPPHLAHVALAQAAISHLRLDELRILPTGEAWHKARPLSAGSHRLAMARLAFEGLAQVVLDDRELRRAGPSYTVETLRELRAERPDAVLFLVVGADQAQGFDRWREPEAIARLATICVAGRPEEDGPDGTPLKAQAVTSTPIPPGPASLVPAAGLPQKAYPIPGPWQPLALPPMPLSATRIRRAQAQGENVAGLVPPAVARYIAQHHLYSPT